MGNKVYKLPSLIKVIAAKLHVCWNHASHTTLLSQLCLVLIQLVEIEENVTPISPVLEEDKP